MSFPTDGHRPSSIREWLAEWLHVHYWNNYDIDVNAARRESLGELPLRLVPGLNVLTNAWWGKKFNDLYKSLGYRSIERQVEVEIAGVDQLPRRMRKQMMMGQLTLLSLEDLALYAVQQFQRIDTDRQAVRRDIEQWVAAHPQLNLNTDSLLIDFERRAAS